MNPAIPEILYRILPVENDKIENDRYTYNITRLVTNENIKSQLIVTFTVDVTRENYSNWQSRFQSKNRLEVQAIVCNSYLTEEQVCTSVNSDCRFELFTIILNKFPSMLSTSMKLNQHFQRNV